MFSHIKIPPQQVYKEFVFTRSQKIANLQQAMSLMQWDRDVTISSSSDSTLFAARNSSMNAIQYEIFKEYHKTDLQRACLFLLARPREETGLSEVEYANTRELHRQIFRLTKIPRSVLSRRVQKNEYVDTSQLWQYCYSRRDWNHPKFLEALGRDFDYALIAGEAMASAESRNNLLEVHDTSSSSSSSQSNKNSNTSLSAMDGWLLHQELMLTDSRVDKIYSELKKWVPHAFHLSKQNQNRGNGVDDCSFDEAFFGVGNSIALQQKQRENFCQKLIQKLGFDLNRGKLEFTSSSNQGNSFFVKSGTLPLSSLDVRIFVAQEKFKTSEESFANLLLQVVRQCGKALYEQNRPGGEFILDQPVSLPRSLALSEAQSILFERHLLPRPSFIKFLLTHVAENQKSTTNVDAETLAKRFLHLTKNDKAFSEMENLLKFCATHEIERNVLLKKNSLEQVPHLWREKSQEYNLINNGNNESSSSKDDNNNFQFELQSLESAKFWAWNQFGYVPTFALGNIYASFLFKALLKDVYHDDETKLDSDIENGNFDKWSNWLRRNIWNRGSIPLNTQELLKDCRGVSSTDTSASTMKSDDETILKCYQEYLFKKLMQ